MNDLDNKTTLVTGAGQGIGRAIAAAFAARGAKVWATDLNETALHGLDCAERRRLDVRDGAAIKALIGEMGAVDILVNAVGFVHNGTVLECGEQDLDFAFDVNVKSMWRTISAALPSMLERGDGCIVNVASVAGSIKGVPNRFAYGTTKAAVVGLTKSVAADYVARGIRCNAICPGTVESPSLEQRLRAQGDYEKARAAFVARQPIGRIGTPEEIADLALYLATATYTTGQTHIIDGGWAN
ncbi:SDR family oxidoreductase [Mesorhizobium sp. SP-1A]|uniref:SDR family oxidoreductase n=1 Tax=Mesorhizobium sp. SP-1A TaxID=3077840 RepID=UPI0028F727CA|nr:SDR family oxidoreductase [Mesorhizobium sp. SP-1A]